MTFHQWKWIRQLHSYTTLPDKRMLHMQEMHLLMCCRQHQKPKRATRDVKGRIDE